MSVLIDPNGGNWRAVCGEPVKRFLRALGENTEARLNLEQYLDAAIERRGLRHLSLARTHDGRWQASTNCDDQDRNAYSVVIDADASEAVKKALVSWRFDLFPERVGFGEDGPVGPEMRRLVVALICNAVAREFLSR